MPAIQAMRSDALALRAKEEVQEKIPSFYNSVSQSLGQSIVTGQDAAEQLLESRMQAANQIAAQLRQKIDGQGALAELTAGAGTKLISSAISIFLSALSKTTVTDILEIGSAIANFIIERQTLQLQWDAAAATYAQWVVQAGYAGTGDFFPAATSAPPPAAGTGPPVTQTRKVTQWLEANIGTPPNESNFNTTLRTATFTTVDYTSNSTQDIPNDLAVYRYRGTKLNGSQEDLYDPDGSGPLPGQPQQKITIGMDNDNSGHVGDSAPYVAGSPPPTAGDTSSDLYYSATTGRYYMRYTYEYTTTVPAGSEVPLPSATITNIRSAEDYQLDNTGTSTLNDDSAPGDSDPYVNNPDIADDTVEYDRSREYYHRVGFGNITITPGGANSTTGGPPTYTTTMPRQTFPNNAIGARGALKYRDSFTPRFTDRRSYAGSQLVSGTAGVGNYDFYYGWGSVGSITRVGESS